jgi:hypothetical protein
MIEYIPVTIYPELSLVFLVQGLTTAFTVGMVAFFAWHFGKTFNLIRRDLELVKISRMFGESGEKGKESELFKFFLLNYLCGESMSTEDKLRFLSYLRGESTDTKNIEAEIKKEIKQEIKNKLKKDLSRGEWNR